MADMPEYVKFLADYKKGLEEGNDALTAEMGKMWALQIKDMYKLWNDLSDEIWKIQEAGGTVSTNKLYTQERYRSMITQAGIEFEKYSGSVSSMISSKIEDIVFVTSKATDEAIKLGYKQFGHVHQDFKALSPARVEKLAQSLSDGAPLKELFKKAGVVGIDGMSRRLIGAIALGYGPRKMAREMSVGYGLAFQRSLVIARDQTMKVHRLAQDEAYVQSGVVKAKRRLSAKSLRTCIGCLAKDGELLPIDVPGYDHVCGRCTFIPILQGLPELTWETGEEWFKKLDPSAQEEMLGKTTYDMWKAGQFPFAALGITHEHDTWGRSIGVPTIEQLKAWTPPTPVKFRNPVAPPEPEITMPEIPEDWAGIVAADARMPNGLVDAEILIPQGSGTFNVIMANMVIDNPDLPKAQLYYMALQKYVAQNPDMWEEDLKMGWTKQVNALIPAVPPEAKPQPVMISPTFDRMLSDLMKATGKSKEELYYEVLEQYKAIHEHTYKILLKTGKTLTVDAVDPNAAPIPTQIRVVPPSTSVVKTEIIIPSGNSAWETVLNGVKKANPGVADNRLYYEALEKYKTKYPAYWEEDRKVPGWTRTVSAYIPQPVAVPAVPAPRLVKGKLLVPDNWQYDDIVKAIQQKNKGISIERVHYEALAEYIRTYPKQWEEDKQMKWTQKVDAYVPEKAKKEPKAKAPKPTGPTTDVVYDIPKHSSFFSIFKMVKDTNPAWPKYQSIEEALKLFEQQNPKKFAEWKAGKIPTQQMAQKVPTSAIPVKPPTLADMDIDHDLLKKKDLHAVGSTFGAPSSKPAYGAVIFNDNGEVLLRKPTGNYLGYAWTWPKGTWTPGESPVDTAIREVEEETGHTGQIIGMLPGGYAATGAPAHFFMMRSTGYDKSKMDAETEDTVWVKYDDAKKLIEQSTTDVGKKRDLAILENAYIEHKKLQDPTYRAGVKKSIEALPDASYQPPAAKAPRAVPAPPPVVTPPEPKEPWKFMMFKEEADKWAKDSALKDTYYMQFSNKKNLEAMEQTQPAYWPKAWTNLPDYYDATYYAMPVKFNVKKPLVFDSQADYDDFYKKTGLSIYSPGGWDDFITETGHDIVIIKKSGFSLVHLIGSSKETVTIVTGKTLKGEKKYVKAMPTDPVASVPAGNSQRLAPWIATKAAAKAVAASKPPSYTPSPGAATPPKPAAPAYAPPQAPSPTPQPMKPSQYTNPPFAMTDLKDTGSGSSLAGVHTKYVLEDKQGSKWLFKPGDQFLSDLDCVTSSIMKHAGLEAPEFYTVTYNGKVGSIQKMYANPKPTFQQGMFTPGSLTADQTVELQKQAVFDWLISNHDTHEGQFITATVGGKPTLVGIDKGQAFKFFGDDKKLSYTYSKSCQTVYNQLHQAYATGTKIDNFQSLSGAAPSQELTSFINKLMSIPDDQYKALLRPYAEGAAKKGFLAKYAYSSMTNNVDAFLDAAVKRKNNLLKDWTAFHDQIETERKGSAPVVAAPPPAQLGLKGTDPSQWTIHKSNKDGEQWAVKRWPASTLSSFSSAETSSMTAYTGSSYEAMNNGLRGIVSLTAPNAKKCRDVDSALQKFPVSEDVVLRRGADPRVMQPAGSSTKLSANVDWSQMVGTVIQDDGFMSTSVGTSAAFSSKPVIMNIYTPKGTPAFLIDHISHYKGVEREVLLGRGLKMYVHSAKRNSYNQWEIEVEVIPGSGSHGTPIP